MLTVIMAAAACEYLLADLCLHRYRLEHQDQVLPAQSDEQHKYKRMHDCVH